MSRTKRTDPLRSWVPACLGLLAAVLGLTPWLVTGGTAPLQNLWATSTPPDEMPFVLLPFSQYHVTAIIGMIVVGAAVAGLVGRALRHRFSRGRFAALVVAVLVVQLVALGQTTLEINAGLRAGTEGAVYLGTLVGVTALAILVGLVSLLLVLLAPRGGAVVGLAVGALALGPWLASPWLLSAVLVGVAIAWAGLGTPGRVCGALVALVLVWIVPPLTTAIQATLGSRALLRDLPGVVDHFLRALVAGASSPAVVAPQLLVCVAVALLGMLLQFLRRSRVG